ncbi:MAG: YeeE/YedE family protein [Planctomycetales bacterium]|nr:YeeE/YedE family protein [Planctomycetales bacterium]
MNEAPSDSPADLNPARQMSWRAYMAVFVMGAYLGILFTKTEVARWERIHQMFLFREVRMYLIISVAIVVAMASMWLMRLLRVRTMEGLPIRYVPKPFHWGITFGGLMFGAGWAITGSCPGPIYAQIGAGEPLALITLLGALLGMYSYAALKPRLPH